MTPDDDAPTEALLDARYQLQECIGEGGMARVHRGFDHALGRSVAIKVMRDGTENASALERARGEMGLLASLSHPSLVTLFDARIAPGRVSYLVMELVDGPTLSGVLHDGPLAPRDAARLVVELADALHVVHAAGIVHRDVKPSNVLLSPPTLPGRPRRARLADFGIAYLADSSRLTTPGVVVGTMAYLAPEQVKGEPPAPPADIYALGLLVIEALTGQRPFGAIGGVESLVTRVTSAPEVPSSLGDEWGGLLRRMTALDPAQRPTASEVATAAAALELVENQPSTAVTAVTPVDTSVPASAARTTELVPPVSRAARRRSRRPLHRHGLAIAGGATAAAAVIVLGAWLFGGPGAAVPSPAETVAVDGVPSDAPTAEHDLDVETVEAETGNVPAAPVESVVVEPQPNEPEAPSGDQEGVEQPPGPDDAAPVDAPGTAPGVSNGADRSTEVAADNDRKAEQRDAAKAAAEAQRAAEKAAKEESRPGAKP
ncbi:serine/threonine protein kinase [Microbacterium sp. Gd 4-13]|uniref:serine/threonine-protein kinase n=1 Tax=Microbacterium sp. Gd 4-13 TaxID=2173179 RepID=UPI000D5872F3|nr:serine/threonine-protein kinase [Microbacterium sp. Gd 4-13]PVW06736.1 serine/threonine protein kinase [Microbacterium sp. Gd 4-13]